MAIKYKRVLIKISGEALAGDDRFGVNDAQLEKTAKQIKEIHDAGPPTKEGHCRTRFLHRDARPNS